jgi:hypothetical protein
MLFQATLIPVKEEAKRQVDGRFNPADFHPERLPKGRLR